MSLVLPEGTSWGVTTLFWILLILVAALFAGILFFIVRFIQKNDEHHTSVDLRLKNQSVEFDALTDKLEEGVKNIDQAAVEMEKAQANFQSSVSKELIEIHKITGEIKNDLTEGRAQVNIIKSDLEKLSETVSAHHKSLSLGATAMQNQREDLIKMKTVIVKLNDDLRIIKGKKEKKS